MGQRQGPAALVAPFGRAINKAAQERSDLLESSGRTREPRHAGCLNERMLALDVSSLRVFLTEMLANIAAHSAVREAVMSDGNSATRSGLADMAAAPFAAAQTSRTRQSLP